jgi:flagellin
MTAALSRIEDVNMAEEMSTYTQLNVLSQAGVSMVAQANERPQAILQMLQ